MVIIDLTDEEATVLRQMMDHVGGGRGSFRDCTNAICDKLYEAGATLQSNDARAFEGDLVANDRIAFERIADALEAPSTPELKETS